MSPTSGQNALFPGQACGPPQLSASLADPDSDSTAQVRLLKQHVATMSEQLNTTNKGPKKIRTGLTLGRGICRLATLYEKVADVIQEVNSQNSEPEGATFDRSRQRLAAAWPIILDLVPSLAQLIQEERDVSVIVRYLDELQYRALIARCEDINRIRTETCFRINKEYKLINNVLDKDDRSDRGFHHDVCGRLICPVTYDWDDLEVREKIKKSKQELAFYTNYYLRCLYSTPPTNPKRIEEGFLRSDLLLKVYASIFTAPASANYVAETEIDQFRGQPVKLNKPAKSSVAVLLGMNGQVTGRSIAYAAVLLVFNLTDAYQWTHSHNNFSFTDLYDFLVDYFEEERSPASTRRVHDLLQWWNARIFPAYPDAKESQKILLEQDDDY